VKQTVPKAIAQRAVKADAEALSNWANLESAPVLDQVRSFANHLTRERVDFTTQGAGNPDLVWESEEMPTDGTWTVFARVTAAGPGFASYALETTVRSVGGAVGAVGATTVWQHATVGVTASLAVDATDRTVSLSFNDGGVGALAVVAVVEVEEAVP
jgi:hypothetical protein